MLDKPGNRSYECFSGEKSGFIENLTWLQCVKCGKATFSRHMRHLLGGARVQTVQDDDMLIVLARTPPCHTPPTLSTASHPLLTIILISYNAYIIPGRRWHGYAPPVSAPPWPPSWGPSSARGRGRTLGRLAKQCWVMLRMLAMHNNQEDDVITGALPELPGVGATFKTQFISRSWEEFPRKYLLVWGTQNLV